jgi:hypothetical protein
MATEDYEARLRQLIDQIRDHIGKIGQDYARLTPKAGEVGGYLNDYAPAGVATDFNTALADINSTLPNVISGAGEWLQDVATLLSLRQHSNGWRTLQTQAAGVAQRLSGDVLQTNLRWQGLGASAYFATIPAQQGAVNKLADLAKVTSETLNTCAETVLTLFAGYVAVLGKLFARIGRLIRECAIIVGAFITAIRAAGLGKTPYTILGVGVVWAICGWAVLRSLRQFAKDAKEIVNDWQKGVALATGAALAIGRQANVIQAHRAAAMTAFPAGRWPPATTSAFDDRDDSVRWTVKPPTPAWTPERPPAEVPNPPPGGP